MPYYFEFDPANRILRGRFEGPYHRRTTQGILLALSGEYFERTGHAFGHYGLFGSDFA